MKRKFDSYLEGDLFNGNMINCFSKWNIDKAMLDVAKWRSPPRWLILYVIANACDYRTLHAWVGCNSKIENRVLQHNGKMAGGPAATRKAAGHWKLILTVEIPPVRNYSTKGIKKMCKRGRGWPSRCRRAIGVALSKDLPWKISGAVFNSNSPFYSENIVEFLSKKKIIGLEDHIMA